MKVVAEMAEVRFRNKFINYIPTTCTGMWFMVNLL